MTHRAGAQASAVPCERRSLDDFRTERYESELAWFLGHSASTSTSHRVGARVRA